ncbi:MAG TPA: CHRD domain-containing protein [Acidimicrobiales bacterium]
MKRARIKFALAVAAVGVVGAGGVALAADGGDSETLTGYEEVPALSTPGVGEFTASVSRAGDSIRYRLTFSDLESAATQAHIHFENETNIGPIVVFLCTNLGNGPAGTQACPAGGGTIRGTIRAADVGAGAAAQGIAAGEFDEFVRAIRAGATYVNVHSVNRAGGEIRAQLGDDEDHDH